MLRLQRGSADPLERRVMGRRWLAVAAAALVTSQLDGATGRVRARACARERVKFAPLAQRWCSRSLSAVTWKRI